MKDFAKSVRTNNADLGLRPVVPQLVKDIGKIYEANGKDREKTKQELIQKHHMSERQAEEVLRQIVGNSKVGNEYKPDVTKTPAEYERLIKQAKKKEELSDIIDDVDYDIKEYEVAIDYCNEQIKQHQRMMSTLRMVQRDAKDALNKI